MEKIRIAISKNHFYTKVKGNETTKLFNVKDLEYHQIAEFIKSGYAITNIFGNKGEFHRAKKYFVSADFFALDFDNDPARISKKIHTYFSLDELLKGKTERACFILKNSFLIYTTQSHSKSCDKFRALFHLPERIRTVSGYERITKAFHSKFPEADTNCIEAARYFYGSAKDGVVKVIGNKLTQETIDSVIQGVNLKKNELSQNPDTSENQDSESYSNAVIKCEILKLKNASKGNKNSTLNSICYVISSTISEMKQQGIQTSETEIKNSIKKIAEEIGLEPEEIAKTIKSGWAAGKVTELTKFKPKEKKLKRTHANKPIKGNLQVCKKILDNLPESNKVDSELKENAIKTQIGFFKTFEIDFKGTLTEQILDKLLGEVDSMKFLRCYFSLWKYAHRIGKTCFENVNLNDILKYSSVKEQSTNDLYKERIQIIEVIKTLGLVSIIRERKSKFENVFTDYEITHLINDLTIVTEKRKTYISCELPKKQGEIGAYIPENIFAISGQDEGSFFIAVELMKEINRTCRSKKTGTRTYESPRFNEKPILWTRKRLIDLCRLGKTDKLNKTETNKSLEKKLIKLKELEIISDFSAIPLNDSLKVKITIPNPEKNHYMN